MDKFVPRLAFPFFCFLSLALPLALAFPLGISLPISTDRASSETVDACGPVDWLTIFLFYIVNYGAHAFTIVTLPGEKTTDQLYSSILALLLPYSGIGKACQTMSRAIFGRAEPLKRALYAGALCEITEEADWNAFMVDERNIHGRVRMPGNSSFTIINREIEFAEFTQDQFSSKLTSNYGIAKTAIGIIQLVYACITLYRNRGNQLQIYGYASYGLTVAQYAVMSLVNLFANLVTPQYPTVYMVRTNRMKWLENRDENGETLGQFEGTVADLSRERDSHRPIVRKRWIRLLVSIIAVLAFAAPYCIIGILTRFQPGTSTKAQRIWIMGWLIASQIFGFYLGWLRSGFNAPIAVDTATENRLMGGCVNCCLQCSLCCKSCCGVMGVFSFILNCYLCWAWGLRSGSTPLWAVLTLAIGAVGIGGFVVVGQMLAVNGSC
jgi:hypothetical protein